MGHPDKFCDQMADSYLDEVLKLVQGDPVLLKHARAAIECLAKDDLLLVSGEVRIRDEMKGLIDVARIGKSLWAEIGYGTAQEAERLTVIDHVRAQSPNIAGNETKGVDAGGAGDQGIMVGYATNETPEFMPFEWVYARDICSRLEGARREGKLPWLGPDCKSQVTINPDRRVTNIIVAAQHTRGVDERDIDAGIREHILTPLLGSLENVRVAINGCGDFIIGGPTGDAGVVGRKIVVDAYGPNIPVGGGAYSGKDPTKVDRSAAYMARHLAKTIVALGIDDARECRVSLAYGIGQFQPEMITAITDTGKDLSGWVRAKFSDLSPGAIIDRLGLRTPTGYRQDGGWTYRMTACFGHYGRAIFPWERVDDSLA
jgi:S-adenosylmethionine synthetase